MFKNIKKITFLLVGIVVSTMFMNTDVFAHEHSASCYAGSEHIHDDSCYGEGTDYRACGGNLEWVLMDTIVGKCPYCETIGYKYDLYVAICGSCGQKYEHYTEREKLDDPIHYCESSQDGVDFTYELPKRRANYPTRLDATDTSKKDFSEIGPSCEKTEGQYYEREKEVAPICNTVAVNVVASKPVQTSEEPDLSIIVTFLDGHTEVLSPNSTNYKEDTPYNGTEIQLIYFGKISIEESGTIVAITKVTNEAGINLANGTYEEEDTKVVVVEEEEEEQEEIIKITYPIKATIIAMVVLFVLWIIGKIYVKSNS